MGGKRTLVRQSCPAPRAEVDRDDRATAVVNDESVAIPTLAVVNESIGAFESVRMQVANILDVGLHHVTAMFFHPLVSHGGLMSAMGRRLPPGRYWQEWVESGR